MTWFNKSKELILTDREFRTANEWPLVHLSKVFEYHDIVTDNTVVKILPHSKIKQLTEDAVIIPKYNIQNKDDTDVDLIGLCMIFQVLKSVW